MNTRQYVFYFFSWCFETTRQKYLRLSFLTGGQNFVSETGCLLYGEKEGSVRWEGQSSYICCSLEHGCFGSCSLSVLGVFRVVRVDLCGALSPVCLGRGGVDGLFALLSVRLANLAVRVLEIEDGATRFCSVIGGAGDYFFLSKICSCKRVGCVMGI